VPDLVAAFTAAVLGAAVSAAGAVVSGEEGEGTTLAGTAESTGAVGVDKAGAAVSVEAA